LKAEAILPCLVWTADGEAFFCLEKGGTLRRITLNEFKEESNTLTGDGARWLSTSAEGLLVSRGQGAGSELLVFDPVTLEKKSTIPIPANHRAVSAPSLSVAITAPEKGGNTDAPAIGVLDLKTSKWVNQYPAKVLQRNAGMSCPQVTGDGKYLLARDNSHGITRYRIEKSALFIDEVSGELGAGHTEEIHLSNDGEWFVLPCGGGSGSARGYHTHVFLVKNLKVPVVDFEQGAYPKAVGVDSRAKVIWAHNYETPLAYYKFTGELVKKIKLGKGGDVRLLATHPEGSRLLVLKEDGLFFVTLL
jgi:hypothetical protein